ncbi:MAG: peptidoglycan-binding domain-containing protein [Bacteroidota bacterium]
MNNHRLLLLLLVGCFSILLPAQDYYTAFVGSFVNARPQEFNEARELGFIYTQTNTDQLEEVFLGQYPTQEKAEGIVERLKNLGFSNAQVVSGYYGDPSEVAVIQIATRYATKSINWENLNQAGSLNVLLADGNIKVLTGTFPNLDAAKAELPRVRNLGFSDAFVKVVKRGQILPVTSIATGIKEELIPLELTESPAPPVNPNPTGTVRPEETNTGIQAETVDTRSPYVPRPTNNETVPAPPSSLPPVQTVSAPTTPEIPAIRGNVKRTSVTDLQRVLQAAGYYNSTLDGYYGNGTTAAYERMLQEDQNIKKYRLLVPFYALGQQASTGAFQQAIDQLPYDANAPLMIQGNNTATGQAYQAYLLFTSLGASQQVNQLMNSAIKRAYANTRVSTQVFNYQATYAYQDLQQLLLHLFYVHASPTNSHTLPCWFNDRHPQETAQAFRQMGNYSARVGRSGCDPFSQWEEVQLLQTIAFDLTPETAQLTAERQAAQSLVSELALSNTAINPTQATLLETWQNSTWRNINNWSAGNAYLQNAVNSLRFTYLQSTVRMEDYYMNRGLNAAEARSLTIATLRAMLEVPLGQFE